MPTSFPEKLYYKIGEVACLAEVRTSVLRYWETEFSFLAPEKSSKGQRLYTKSDIALVIQVRDLLYKEKFTIEGVRKKLGSKSKRTIHAAETLEVTKQISDNALLIEIKNELIEIKKIIEK